MNIFINAGHDKKYDPGACNPISGMREADVADEVAQLVGHYLEAVGFNVKQMQSDNLAGEGYHWDRQHSVCEVANNWPADLFLSIHCNAFNTQANGTECLIHLSGSTSEKLAECIQNQIVTSLSTTDRGIKERPNLIVLRRTSMPAVLIELAFIDNPNDAFLLETKKDEFARAIARGVTDYTSSL